MGLMFLKMRLKEFDFYLPKKLIAQSPIRPRDCCRLLVLDRKNKKIFHCYFYEIDKFLFPGDVLVLNNSKVIPARLYGKKEATLGKVEILLLKRIKERRWQALGKKIKKNFLNKKIIFSKNLWGEIKRILGRGQIEIEFNLKGKDFFQVLKKIGQTPTPPYIKTKVALKNYQTIYAQKEGSVAAPTAGFHFTKRLFQKLKKKGIEIRFVTLHINLATFFPLREEDLKKHQIFKESVEIKKETAEFLNQAKKEKRRIIAVGTTSLRALESFAENRFFPKLKFGKKETNLFIYPGYKFKFVDGLITNFHLPKSSLILLVSAFATKSLIFKAYQEAIKKNYRFFSFGDAMFIF